MRLHARTFYPDTPHELVEVPFPIFFTNILNTMWRVEGRAHAREAMHLCIRLNLFVPRPPPSPLPSGPCITSKVCVGNLFRLCLLVVCCFFRFCMYLLRFVCFFIVLFVLLLLSLNSACFLFVSFQFVIAFVKFRVFFVCFFCVFYSFR